MVLAISKPGVMAPMHSPLRVWDTVACPTSPRHQRCQRTVSLQLRCSFGGKVRFGDERTVRFGGGGGGATVSWRQFPLGIGGGGVALREDGAKGGRGGARDLFVL